MAPPSAAPGGADWTVLVESILEASAVGPERVAEAILAAASVVTASGSAAGARAATSHTAALAGHDRVVADLLDHAGVVRVRAGLELLDAARALDRQPPALGDRVAWSPTLAAPEWR
jgi:acyl-CoA synthetase (NDP forming)